MCTFILVSQMERILQLLQTHCAVGKMGLVPQRSCQLFTSVLPHCYAMVREALLQTSPCFLKLSPEGWLNPLKQRAHSCKNTALHNPYSLFCRSFFRKWMLLYLDLTGECSAARIKLFWLWNTTQIGDPVWHLLLSVQCVRLVDPRNALTQQPLLHPSAFLLSFMFPFSSQIWYRH